MTQSATDLSYLSQSKYLQLALEGQHIEHKSKDDEEPEQKPVLSWGHDKESSKNSLLSTKAGGFPPTMAKEQNDDEEIISSKNFELSMAKEQNDEEDTISSKKFETSDEQVVKAFIGGNVAQNSKSIHSILGDMMLSPDDQGMFSSPQDEKKAEGTKSDVQNQTSLASNDQGKSDMQNQTVLATTDQNRSDVRNKTSLATVGSAIKNVIKSVENSSWPWSKNTKPDSSAEVIAKDVSNNTKAVNQDASVANKTDETKTSSNDTILEHSNKTATTEDVAKAPANGTVLDKSNNLATEEDAAKVNDTVVEKSNKTATQEDIATATKSNKTSETKASVNDTAASNNTDKK